MLKFMLVRDFKAEKSEPYLSQFIYNAKNIIKKNALKMKIVSIFKKFSLKIALNFL